MSMMNQTAASMIGAAQRVSPQLAASLALPLFMRVGTRMAVHPEDAPTMESARRWTASIPSRGHTDAQVAVYEWGSGAEVVLLVHGWQGRASQFAPLVRELRSEGLRVVAFDAPAHGDSAGRRTYIIDWIEAIRAVQARHGALAGMVGHSFGGLAALVAATEGVQVGRVVTAAAPADAESMFRGFRTHLGYDQRVHEVLKERFARRYFPTEDPFARVTAVDRALPASVRTLIAHDLDDRIMPHSEAVRLRAAIPYSMVLDTRGAGHARILRDDAFLDATVEMLARRAAHEPQLAQAR